MNDTRLQLHWAAQAPAGVGRTLIPPQPDDSHSAFTWSRTHRAMLQGAVADGWRAGLRVRDLTLIVIDANDVIDDELPLTGRTLADAFAWLEAHAARLLARPGEGVPLHPVAGDARFAPDANDLARFDALFDDSDALLQQFVGRHAGSEPVRIWPHHFDIATVTPLDGDRRATVGMTPGDEEIATPYWYVTPSPVPEQRSRPPLRSGMWHAEPWFGAVLPATSDAATTSAFLDEALALV